MKASTKDYFLLLLLLIPALVCPKKPFRSIKATRETVENYELLTPVVAYKDNLLPYPSEMVVEIPTSTHNFTLILSMNQILMPGQFTSIIVHNKKDIIDKTQHPNCYYQGKVKDHPDWIVTMSACDGLQGEFGSEDDKENFFHLEPVDQFNPSINQLHALYLEAEYETKPGECGCGNWKEDHLNSSDLEFWQEEGARRVRRLGYYQELCNRKVRRQGSVTRYVEWVIVNDNRQFRAHGSNITRMIQRSLSIANAVDTRFRQLNIRVVLIRVITFALGDEFRIFSDSERLLSDFTDYVRSTQRNRPYDSTMLFTGINVNSGIIGLARLGTMCDRRLSTALTQDGGDSLLRVSTIAAHELGHVFKMYHDNGRSCDCPDSRCIMFASLRPPIPTQWSSCSVDDLNVLYDRGDDSCLFNTPVPLVLGQPTCGDGIVEGNETCDCGYPAECTNVCCNATTCQVADGMECATGECCTSQCRLKRYGTECRPSTGECDVAEYCLGESNECPEDDYVADGFPCKSNLSYCMEGVCPLTHDEQCGLAFNSEAGFTSCFNANVEGNELGNCGQSFPGFISCEPSDVLCGKLQCMEGGYTGVFGFFGRVTTLITEGTCNGFTPFSRFDRGEGLVQQNTKCGEEQVCNLNRCMMLESLNLSLPCPVGNNNAECSGPTNGICTNRGTCSCKLGFMGIACEVIRTIADCGKLSDPVDGHVSHPVTSEGGYADYSCNPGFFLVGAPFRRCLSNGSWTDTDPTCEEYNITLIFESSTAVIMEPSDKKKVAVEYCYKVVNNTRQVSNAVFDINILLSSNASISSDFYLNTSNPLVVEAGLGGNYEDCIEFVVIGDNLVEGPEAIFFSIDGRSAFYQVLLPHNNDSSSSFLVLYIADNVGNFLPFGEAAGDTELSRRDTISSPPQMMLNFVWPIFGQSQRSIWVNSNGVLSFRFSFGSSFPRRFPFRSSAILVAPFWNDVDVGFAGRALYRFSNDPVILKQVATKINSAFEEDFDPALLFVTTWDRVATTSGNSTTVNSFQVILVSDEEQTYVLFLYREIQWGRGRSTIGFNEGDGVRFYALAQPFTSSSFVLERDSNVNEPGTYIFRVDQNQITSPSDCELLSDPANGIVSSGRPAIGSTVQYTCNTGFVLSGEDTRLCLENSSWSGVDPTCEECEDLSDPPNGRVFISIISRRSVAQYSCNSGFFLVGEETRECYVNTSWSGMEPICEEYDVTLLVLNHERTVFEPPHGENTTVDVCFTAQLDSPLSRNSVFLLSPFDTTASLGNDYLINPSMSILTIPSGFSGNFSACISIVVLGDDVDEYVERISYNVSAQSLFDRVVFSPDASVSLIVVTIQDTGNLFPFGVAVGDSMLRRTFGGASAPQVTMGIRFPFFGQDEDTIYVNANGVLSFRTPFSDSTPDPFPLPRSNILVAPFWNEFNLFRDGNVFYRFSNDKDFLEEVGTRIETAFGEDFLPKLLFVATWDRVPGFGSFFRLTNSFQVVLASDGEQTFALFLYREIQWGRTTSTVGFNAGDRMRFYVLDQPNSNSMTMLEVQSNVNESGVYIFKVNLEQVISPSDCTSLPDPVNGTLTLSNGTRVAQYFCDPGFVLIGEDIRVCLENRSWSGMEPVCQECENLSNPPNGSVFVHVNFGINTAQYSCDTGFVLVGEDTRVCFENTSWSGTEPTCEEYDVTFRVLDYDTTVFEPPLGENVTVDVCFTAQLDLPLDRDSIFDIVSSSNNTASLGDDYIFASPIQTVTIPSGFSGIFSTCISIVILGDDETENSEFISYEIRAQSIFDQVVFPSGENLDLIAVTIIDTGNLIPFGEAAGDSVLSPTLDGASPAQRKNFSFPFFGRDEDTIYVNANGILSFRGTFSDFSPDPFPLRRNAALVAPFWNDVDVRRGGNIFFRFSEDEELLDKVGTQIEAAFRESFFPNLLFIATWHRVPGISGSLRFRNSYQTVLASDGEQTYVLFLYREIQWGRDRSTVGLNAGDGVRFYALDQPFITSSLVLERDSNVNEPGTYILRVDQDRVILPLDCEILPHPANGSVFNVSPFIGGTAQYACDAGFVLIGEDTRVCNENVSWSGIEPTCKACEDLFSPPNGAVFITVISGRSTAQYFCDMEFFLVGEDTRVCFENTSWSGMEPTCRGYDVTLFVLNYETTIREPTLGENVTVNICFMAQLDLPLDRESIFDISLSPDATASLGDDYLLNSPTQNLTIPSGFSGNFSTCISIVVLGDNETEGLETVSFEIEALSLFDRVAFPPEANSSLIIVNILDTGNLIPFGEAAGDSVLSPTLDGASSAQRKNFSCPFFGRDEDTIYVNANGILSFRGTFSDFSPDPFPLRRNAALVAPFWNDVDVRRGGNIFFRFSEDEELLDKIGTQIEAAFQESFFPDLLFIATWHRVPGFSGSLRFRNSYQTVLASDGEQTYVLFLYREIQWGRDRSTVGLNAGDGVRFYALDQPNITSSLVLERDSNVNEPGTYIFRVDQDRVILPLDCEILPHPANGSVFSVPGGTAQYACDAGFVLIGEDTRVCNENMSWSGIEPTCEACEDLFSPPNGAVFITVISGRSTAQYFCDMEFFLVGEDTRVCFENTSWSGMEPTCQGYDVTLFVLNYETTIREPTLGDNVTVNICFMAQLDLPLDRESIFDISLSPDATASLGDDYLLNSPTQNLTIPSGFSGNFSTCISIVVLGDNEAEGLETVSFEIEALSLFDRVAFPPEAEANSSLIIVNILDTGNLLPFGLATGDSTLFTDDGASPPQFMNSSCPFFGREENIIFVNANGLLSLGNPFSEFTPRPFPLRGAALVAPFWNDINVRQGGNIFFRFSEDERLFEEVDTLIEGGFQEYFTSDILFVATWHRVPQFGRPPSLTNTFQVVVACDGEQTYVLFLYREIQWGRDSSTLGLNAGDGVRFYALDQPIINSGLVLERDSNVDVPGVYIFRVDQSQVLLPTAQSICEDLPDPDDGSVFYESTTEGSVANYSCDPGTVLVGDEVRVCLVNGSWSGMEPVCEVQVCEDLPNPDDGSVFLYENATEGSVANYSCDPGTVLVGDEVRVCLLNGSWSGIEPVCEVLVCEDLPDPNNGRVLYESTTEGSLANYSCDPCTVLVGDEVRVCLFNGSWSGIEPTCEENNGALFFEQSRYESVEDIGLRNHAILVCLNIFNLCSRTAVTVSTISGTAFGGEDYIELTKQLILNVGEAKRCFGVIIYEDQKIEADESFFVRVEGLGMAAQTEIIILDDDDISFNFTGNSPMVRNNHVTFQLSLGSGIVAAQCAVLQRDTVLEETDCSSGRAEFANLPPRFVELTPQITTRLRNRTLLVTNDRRRNFRLGIGSRRRCSVHLINEGVTERNSSGVRVTTIEWGLSGPSDVLASNMIFLCSLDGGELNPCVSPMILRNLSGSHTLFVRPPRNLQGCIRRIPRIFNF